MQAGNSWHEQLEFGWEGAPPRWRQVDVKGVRVERVRRFGRVYLGLALWRRLKLHEHLESLINDMAEV